MYVLLILRGAIVNTLVGSMVYIKTYLVPGIYQGIQLFLLTIFGPINYGPP